MTILGGKLSKSHLDKMIAGRKKQARAARTGKLYINYDDKQVLEGKGKKYLDKPKKHKRRK